MDGYDGRSASERPRGGIDLLGTIGLANHLRHERDTVGEPTQVRKEWNVNRGRRILRRHFLASAASTGAAGLLLPSSKGFAAENNAGLRAGEGVADITPPLGIEMGGFHRPPGKERRIEAIRQPAAVRALVLELGGTQVAICSLDVAAIGREMADRIRREAARQTGIPEANIRVAATHTL
jgi:hypothetical protein